MKAFSHRKNLNDYKGATMVEFAIVALLLVLLLLAIIDLSRFLLIKNVLREGSKQMVRQAIVHPHLGYDMRPSASLDTRQKSAIKAARNSIVSRAVGFVHNTTLSPSTDPGGYQETYRYRFPDPENPGTDIEVDAALLLPGQQGQVRRFVSDGVYTYEPIHHPTCPRTPLPNGTNCGDFLTRPGAQGWEEMIITHPYYAEMSAILPTFLFGNLEITGKASSWRELYPLGAASEPELLPTPTPIPPPPQRCDEVTDQAAFCATNCTSPHQDCVFAPNNTVDGSCGSCPAKGCDDFTTEDAFCASTCGNSFECNFDAAASAPNCGGCGAPIACPEQFPGGQEEYCSQRTCGAGQECVFSPDNSGNNCGSCQAVPCTEQFANQEEFCQTQSCGATQDCTFVGTSSGSYCGGCVPRPCTEQFASEEEFCATQNCGDTTVCQFAAGSSGNYCGGCVAKPCTEQFANEAEFCATQNCGDGTVCQFNSGGSGAYCGSCRSLRCEERYPDQSSQDDLCAALGCAANQECSFSGGSTGSVCASCRTLPCVDTSSAEEVCPGGCGDGQTCDFRPSSPDPYCGQGCVCLPQSCGLGEQFNSTSCACEPCPQSCGPGSSHSTPGSCNCVSCPPQTCGGSCNLWDPDTCSCRTCPGEAAEVGQCPAGTTFICKLCRCVPDVPS